MKTDAVSELIVDVCARIILPRHGTLTADQVLHKRPGDLVTIADREAEMALTAAFARETPDALVVGEEACFEKPGLVDGLPDAEHAWVIDPIDGTRNFASARSDFGVMVAELRAGVTVRSWIWQPLHGRLYVAELGAGASVNGVPLPPLVAPHRPWPVAGAARLHSLDAPGIAPRRTRGSCAIDYPMLAQGELAGLVYRSMHPWDHLPGALLVSEAGGAVLRDGRPYAVGTTGKVLVAGASEATASEITRLVTHR